MTAESSATLKVVALGFLLLFLIFVGLATPFYLKQREVLKSWTQTDARVESSEVVPIPEKHGTTYDARIVVAFPLGNVFETTMITSGYRSRLRAHAQQWVDRFPAGASVRVAYNPLDPTKVRLDPGYNRYFFAVPLLVTEVGLVFAAIAAIFYFVARLGQRRSSAA